LLLLLLLPLSMGVVVSAFAARAKAVLAANIRWAISLSLGIQMSPSSGDVRTVNECANVNDYTDRK
jgi:hypothetical protein